MATGINPDVRYCSQCGQPAPPDELASFGGTLICPNCKYSFVQKLREGVTPIQARFSYAGFWIRFVAELIDGIILAVAGSAVMLLFMSRSIQSMQQIRPDSTPQQALMAFGTLMGTFALGALVGMMIGAAYEGFFVSRVGATPGKMALSLKVVRTGGGPLSLGRAIGRYFAKRLSALTLYIGYIIAGFDAEKRAMHDMICDTRVIKLGDAEVVPYAPQQI